MTRQCVKAFTIIVMSMAILVWGGYAAYAEKSAAIQPQEELSGKSNSSAEPGGGNISDAPANPPAAAQPPVSKPAPVNGQLGNKPKTDFVVDPQKAELGAYMEELVDNFEFIMDVSASKLLPYEQQTKLKVCKDVVRRMNPKIPERPLWGALRRYGYEAGAFTERTALLFPENGSAIGSYDRLRMLRRLKLQDGPAAKVRWRLRLTNPAMILPQP